jgi:hypothetical protein
VFLYHSPAQAVEETELLSPYTLKDSSNRGIGRRLAGRDNPSAMIAHDAPGSLAATLSQSSSANTLIHPGNINTLNLGGSVKGVNISGTDQGRDWKWAGFAAAYEDISK